MKSWLRNLIYLTVGLCLGLSISLASKENAKSYHSDFDYPLLQDVLDTVETYYVKTVTRDELIEAAIKGIFEHLDPYSSFLNQRELSDLQDANRGEYFGFGFEVNADKEQIRVVAPFANSPAEQAGIQAGDTVIRLNNTQVTQSNLSEILTQIKQHSLNNQSITLTLRHLGKSEEFTVQLRPSAISMQSVSDKLLAGNIGYIRLSSFQENSTQDMIHALSQWQSSHLSGLILDLRNNPGGLLEQAIQIADLFLAKGRIVSTSGRYFDANADYYASPQTILSHVPMLVLINKGSASAAEVLAAALQENGRAKLLGETSFGKGTVQSLIPILNDGNAIKLTIAQYQTPRGENIHEVGIVPDIKIAADYAVSGNDETIIDAISARTDISQDSVVNSAITWIRHHD